MNKQKIFTRFLFFQTCEFNVLDIPGANLSSESLEVSSKLRTEVELNAVKCHKLIITDNSK